MAAAEDLVGNDVVDLDDPDIASSHLRDRFVERVCDPAERARVRSASDPKVLLWTMFAAKEAAYKVLVKLGCAPGFAHRRLGVAADLRSVRFEGVRLRLWIDRRVDGAVHAVASTGARAPLSDVRRVAFTTGGPRADAGVAARRLACVRVARSVGRPAAALAIERAPLEESWDGFGPPVLLCDGRPCPGADVSLSHDGRFVAFAAAIVPEIARRTGASATRSSSRAAPRSPRGSAAWRGGARSRPRGHAAGLRAARSR